MIRPPIIHIMIIVTFRSRARVKGDNKSRRAGACDLAFSLADIDSTWPTHAERQDCQVMRHNTEMLPKRALESRVQASNSEFRNLA